MSEQPEALRLADALDDLMGEETLIGAAHIDRASYELRRLHAENTEIRTLNDDLFYQGLAVINEKQELLDAAVKAEREACAKMFDGEVWAYDYREIAAAIRARGEK